MPENTPALTPEVEAMREDIVQLTRKHDSDQAVTAAEYTIVLVMNEEDPGLDDTHARQLLAQEIQDAIDAGHFMDIRYDALSFQIVRREILHTEPARPKRPTAV